VLRYVQCLFLGVGLLAQGQTVRQEGQFVERFMLIKPVRWSGKVARIEIFSRAHVVVRGTADGSFGIALRQRVRATSLEDAAAALGPLPPMGPLAPTSSTLRLQWYPQSSRRVDSMIEVMVPYQVGSLVVSNQANPVEVYDIAGDVRVETSGGPLMLDRIGGDVRAHTGLGEVLLGTIGGSVRCSTNGGMIGLVSSGGEVNCITGGGDIEIGSVKGALVVSTEGGNIHVLRADGTVQAKSAAGLVDVEEARGRISADSSAGAVRVRGGSGALTVSAMLGDILAELFNGGRLANSSLVSGSGDITVMIPAGLGLAVRAQNGSGSPARVVSEFPEMQARSVGWHAPAAVSSIQGGGPVVDVTTNGTVYLRKAK
jgi:DUF4097 and DUF4098 domain-containing protein YvlB